MMNNNGNDCEILGCLGDEPIDLSLLGGQPVNLSRQRQPEAHTDLLLCLLGLSERHKCEGEGSRFNSFN